jgi:hypothetical protein
MADKNWAGLTPWVGSIDIANDLVAVWKNSNSTLYKATPNQLANLTSQWVGRTDTQTLTNKTLTAPTISAPVLSGTITGTYTLGGTPTFPAAVVTLTGAQTLTNKILTSPTINGPTITNATITANAITGFTTSNTGTVYGISIATGVLTTASSVAGTALVNSSVTPDKLNTGAQVSVVAAASTTAGVGYGNLADAITQSVTVTVGANGLVLLTITASAVNSGANENRITYVVSGANTIAAADANCVVTGTGAVNMTLSKTVLLKSLTPGVTTFALSYRVTGGTGTFFNREITVVPL